MRATNLQIIKTLFLALCLCLTASAELELEKLGRVHYQTEQSMVLFNTVPPESTTGEKLTMFVIPSLTGDRQNPETASFHADDISTVVDEIRTSLNEAKQLEAGTIGQAYKHSNLFEKDTTFAIAAMNSPEVGPVVSLLWVRDGSPQAIFMVDDNNIGKLTEILGQGVQ